MAEKQNVELREIRAFRRVFGEDGSRNSDQKIVLGALMRDAGMPGPCFQPQKEFGVITEKDGSTRAVALASRYDPIAAAITDGMQRTVSSIIEKANAKPANADDD